MSLYEKSWQRPNLLGQKLNEATMLGYKTAQKAQHLGQKARRYFEQYGRHLPSEVVERIDPLLSKFEKGSAKAEEMLGTALQLKKGRKSGSNVPSRGVKQSGGSGSRPSHRGHMRNKQHEKRVLRQ
jgi:hypothetical protein